MTEITEDQLMRAEAELLAAKDSEDSERKTAAMQAFGDLRMAWRLQEEAAGRRNGLRLVVENHVAEDT